MNKVYIQYVYDEYRENEPYEFVFETEEAAEEFASALVENGVSDNRIESGWTSLRTDPVMALIDARDLGLLELEEAD